MWKIVSADRLKSLEETIQNQKAQIDDLSNKLNEMTKSNFKLELENVTLKKEVSAKSIRKSKTPKQK